MRLQITFSVKKVQGFQKFWSRVCSIRIHSGMGRDLLLRPFCLAPSQTDVSRSNQTAIFGNFSKNFAEIRGEKTPHECG